MEKSLNKNISPFVLNTDKIDCIQIILKPVVYMFIFQVYFSFKNYTMAVYNQYLELLENICLCIMTRDLLLF